MSRLSSALPSTYRKLMVQRLSQHFREAAEIVTATSRAPEAEDIVVKNKYVGINASDINFSAGRYGNAQLPMECGFEGVGTVVAAGHQSGHKVGQAVLYMNNGAFADYITLPGKIALPIPSAQAEFVPFMVSGLTAAIALDKVGEIKSGQTVLVTAAAGGTGQFAVQWAKQAGCHVIGTCSSDAKVEFLKSLGCDHVINYKEEDLRKTLKTQYPGGVDVVYESVGGDMFNTAVDCIAMKGRVIIIGFISAYESDSGVVSDNRIVKMPAKLLAKSASVRGFLLFHYGKHFSEYLGKMTQLYSQGTLRSMVDNGIHCDSGSLKGLEAIYDGVDYLYSRKSVGKIVVELGNDSKL